MTPSNPPSPSSPNILVIDADDLTSRLTGQAFRDGSLPDVETTADGVEAEVRVAASAPDLVVLDLHLPGGSALRLLERLRQRDPDLPVVVVASDTSSSTVIEAMSLGAYDVLRKPLEAEFFAETLSTALAQRRARMRASEPPGGGIDPGVDFIIATNAAMVELVKRVGIAARSAAPVLLCGEPGTGRKLLARAIHRHSARGAQPFIVVDAGSLPEALLERELFGEAGVAAPAGGGAIDRAAGGTLYVDALEEASPRVQQRLAELVAHGTFGRGEGAVASSAMRSESADVRVMGSVTRPPEELLRQRRLMPELHDALNVMPLEVPPLRERLDDLAPLLTYFLRAHRGLHPEEIVGIEREAMDALRAYDWPGNVRELEGAVRRAMAVARGRTLRRGDFVGAWGGGALGRAGGLVRAGGSTGGGAPRRVFEPAAGPAAAVHNGWHRAEACPADGGNAGPFGWRHAAGDGGGGGAIFGRDGHGARPEPGSEGEPESLEAIVREAARSHLNDPDAPQPVHGAIIDRVERAVILTCYEECRRNQSETARRLGISRNNLRTKLKDYGVLV